MFQKKLYFFLCFLAGIFLPQFAGAQIITSNAAPYNTATNLVNNILLGGGVTASNIQSTGPIALRGFFNGINSNLGLDSGVVLTCGCIADIPPPGNSTCNPNNQTFTPAPIVNDLKRVSNTAFRMLGINGDANEIHDMSVIEFDFDVTGDSLEFNFVFASDEYLTYVNSQFNDVFAFFLYGPGITPTDNVINVAGDPLGADGVPDFSSFVINGITYFPKNIAVVPNTNPGLPITISSVHPGLNSQYYIDNPATTTVNFNGFTTKLKAQATVQCGQKYHIRLAVSDVSDGILKTGVFLEAGSFKAKGIEISLNTVLGDANMYEGCSDATIDFVRQNADTPATVHFSIGGTATNGGDYAFIPDSVTMAIGQDTASVTITLLADMINEGTETMTITVYNIVCTGDTIIETATLFINEGYGLDMASVNDTVTCALDPVSISSSASGGMTPYIYNWDNGMNGTPITVNPIITDSFIVTAYDVLGCKGLDTIIVTVEHPLPITNAGISDSICPGSSVVIGGAPTGPTGSTYSWTPSATLNSSTAANPTATPTATTSYIVTVTDTNTCKNKDTVIVTLFSLPVAKAGNDTVICTGNSVQIGGSPTGPLNSTFSWLPPVTLNNSSLANPTATPVANTDYIVVVTDTNNCKNKDTVSVSLFALPVAVASNDTAICIGDSVQLIGSGGVSYNWSPPAGLSTIVNDTAGASPNITTTYILTVTDNNNCADTESVTITVNNLPLADAGNDTSLCLGDTLPLGGSPTSATGISFTWSPATNLSSASVANPDAFPVSTITYTVVVSDANICFNSDSIVVIVNNLPVADAGNDTTICTGNSMQIGGSPTGPVGSAFNWSPPGTLNNSSLANPTATPVANTDYIVTVTDTNSCINSDTVNVSLFALPVAIAGNDTAICIGDTIQLIASGGILYSWSPAAGLNTTLNDTVEASPVTTTVYTITVTDVNGCSDTETVIISVNNLPGVDAGNDTAICIGDTVQIGGSPTSPTGISFTWSPATNLSSTSIANPDAFPVSTITYTVVVSDANICFNSDSIVVSVNNLPVADAGNDTTICTGNSVQIGGSPTGPAGSVFGWSPPGTLNNSSLANPTATPAANTDYIVTVTDTNSCINSDTVNVSLFTLPVAIAGNDTAICIGDTIELIASGGILYSWSPAAGLNTTSNDTVEASPVTTTVYTITVTDVNGCSDTETVTISVNNLPGIDAGNDTAICIGDTVQIGGSPTSPTGISFTWSPATNLSNTSVANPEAFPVSTQTYIVVVSDANTCTNSDSIVVTVNNLPVVDAGADTTICDGVPVVIGGNPTGPLNSTFNWSPATSLTSANAANPTATPSSNITYTVTVTDTNSCVNTDDVSFVVNANPVSDAGPGGTICVGDSLPLTGSGGGAYSWTPLDSLTDPNISDPVSFPADTTIYYLIVTDGNNCKDTDSVTVNVNQLPPADAGPDLWVCPNDSIMITATGGIIYDWSPAAGLSATNIANPMASPADTTEYFVTVTDANGCVNNDSMILDVGPTVPTDAGTDKAICIGDTAQIGGNPTAPSGSAFSWNTSTGLSDTAIANPLAFPVDTIMYYVTSTNFTCTGLDSVLVIVAPLPNVDAGTDVPVCIFDSTQLNATGGISYAWTPADSLSDDSIANPFAFPTDTTEYFVTAIDINGCVNIDSLTVIVNPLPAIIISNDVEICIGDSTQLSASGGVDFAWLPADSLTDDSISNPVAFPSDTTNYVVTVTDGNGCVNSEPVIITVSPLPTVTVTATPASICIGDTTQLNATGGNTYSWFPVDSLSNSNVSAPFAFPSDTTTYVVTVVDSNSCVNKDSVIVTVNPLPDVDAGPDVAICIFDSTQLNASGGMDYVWIPADSLSDDSIPNPFAFPTDTTEYFVTAIDINGCINIDSITVIVNPLPAIIISNDVEICIGDSTQLNASGGVNYIWLPADSLTDDSISNPVAFPSDTTTYVVTVTDGNSCMNKDSVIVTVNPLPTISITGNLMLCFGDTTQLTASGPVLAGYSWLPVDSLDNPDIFNPLAFPSDTTTYTVTVVDSNTCINSDSATIIVNPLPDVDAGLDDTICTGDTTQLNASGAINYFWTPSDSLSAQNISNPLAYPTDTMEYFVSGTDNNSCTNTDSVIIIVNSLPVVIIGQDTEICIGDSAQLFAAGGNTYAWSPTDSLTNPVIFNPIAFPSDTTIYVVTVTDINNCVNKDSVTVEVNLLPSNILGSDLEICIGDSTQLNGSGGNNYSWTPTGSLDNPNIQNPIAFPSDTTMYIVTVVDSNGCSNSDSITVEVNLLPVVDAGLNDTICVGDTAQLNATGAVNYIWNPSGGLSDSTISNPLAFPTDTIEYFVTGTDSNSCSNNDSVKIIVNSLPVITISPDTEICIGDSTQLSAGGGISYSWFPADSLTDPFIFNPIAFPADTTTYVVTVIDGNNCINKDSVTVEINPLPSNILGSDLEICIGDSVQLNATGGDNYSWFPADSITDSAISNPIAFPSDTTMYIVTVVDSNGCSNSDSITIEVAPIPIVDAGTDDSVCFKDSVQLLATGGDTYLWQPGTGLSDATIPNPMVSPSVSTMYYATITDSNSCSGIDSVLITVNPLPNADAGVDTNACDGDSVQLNATGGITYLWDPSTGLNNVNISNPIATISGTVEYFVSVTDSNSCSGIDSITVEIFNSPAINAGVDDTICSGDTIQLNAAGGSLYSWNPANSLSDATVSNPFASPAVSTEYFVSALDTNGCAGIDSVFVKVNPLPGVNAGNDTSICIGDTIQLNATGAADFLWNPNTDISNPNIANPFSFPSVSIKYFVIGTDSNNCINTDSITITINPLPIADAGNDTSGCSGGLVQLNASGGAGYTWAPTTGLSNPNISNPIATLLSDSMKYFVTITDVNGCKGSDSLVVKTFSISISPDTAICTGDSASLSASPFSGYQPYTYLWSPAIGLNNAIIANPNAAPDASITYSVKVTENSGCSDSAEINITVNGNPIADFTFRLEPSCLGAVAEFENKSENADSYLWIFGDNKTSSKENPDHEFLYNQTMEVTLVATNGSGCDDSSSVSQSIKSFDDYFDIIVPNVFTPDGDGKNDWFEIRFDNKLQECTDVKIFNRWGEMIFASSGNQHSWSGRTFSGEEAPNGTYFFVFDINGKEFKGAVTLVR